SIEPNGVCLAQVLYKFLGVGDLRIVCMEHGHVLHATLLPGRHDLSFVVGLDAAIGILVAARRRHDYEISVRSAGKLDEPIVYDGTLQVPADNNQGPFGRTILGRLLSNNRYCEYRQQ